MRAESYDLDDLNVSAVSWEIRNQQTDRMEAAAVSSDHPKVKKILYHPAAGPGDAHFADVYMETGTVQRVFSLTQVVFNHETSSDDTERADGSENNPDDSKVCPEGKVDGQD